MAHFSVYYVRMNAISPNVQWRGITGRGMVPGMSVDPLAQEEEEKTERLSVDPSVSDAEFLRRFANYRNSLNEAQSRRVKKWTRKSAAEAFIAAQVRQVRESMAQVFKELGELPEDDKAMLDYAKKVLAAADKSVSKKSR
jgi:hypothetical protein